MTNWNGTTVFVLVHTHKYGTDVSVHKENIGALKAVALDVMCDVEKGRFDDSTLCYQLRHMVREDKYEDLLEATMQIPWGDQYEIHESSIVA